MLSKEKVERLNSICRKCATDESIFLGLPILVQKVIRSWNYNVVTSPSVKELPPSVFFRFEEPATVDDWKDLFFWLQSEGIDNVFVSIEGLGNILGLIDSGAFIRNIEPLVLGDTKCLCNFEVLTKG